jgi:hypothetical protein
MGPLAPSLPPALSAALAACHAARLHLHCCWPPSSALLLLLRLLLLLVLWLLWRGLHTVHRSRPCWQIAVLLQPLHRRRALSALLLLLLLLLVAFEQGGQVLARATLSSLAPPHLGRALPKAPRRSRSRARVRCSCPCP